MKRATVFAMWAMLVSAAFALPANADQTLETLNMTEIGRNASGPNRAAYVSDNYVLSGNGAYLEIYEVKGTLPYLEKKGSLLLPDVVEDIYAVDQKAYVACNGAGLQIVDISNPAAPFLRGAYDTPGTAMGVFVYENRAYVADGPGGLRIVNVSSSASPYSLGSYSLTNRIVRDVKVDLWASGSGIKTVAYVAADTAGIWALDVTPDNEVTRLGALRVSGAATRLFLSSTIAYVAAGSEGLSEVSITNPTAMAVYRTWNPATDVAVTDVFVQSSRAYLADSLFGVRVLDVSDVPNEIASLATGGTAVRITHSMPSTAPNTAFVSDCGGGLLMLNVFNPQPALIRSVQTGDSFVDVAFRGNVLFAAGRKSGLWILNRSAATLTDIPVLVHVDSLEYCQGVAVRDTLLLVSNGRHGVKVMSVRNPLNPRVLANIPVPDEAQGVAFDGNRAVIAGGSGGVHVYNILDPRHPIFLGTISLGTLSARSIEVNEVRHVAFVSTGAAVQAVNLDALSFMTAYPESNNSQAADLSTDGNTLYVADGVNGMRVYDVTNAGAPRAITGMAYNTSGFASDIRMSGDAAVLADGNGTIRILSVSQSPVEVGVAHTAGFSTAVDMSGDSIAVADGAAGLYLFKANFAGHLVSGASRMEFGTVVVHRPRSLYLTLQNTGTRVVHIQSVRSTSGNFSTGTVMPITIYPNRSYTLGVYFQPTAVQYYQDVLTLVSDADNPEVTIPVTGLGVSDTPLTPYTPDYYTYMLYRMEALPGDTLVPDSSLYGYLDGRNHGAQLLSADSAKAGFGRVMKFETSDYVDVQLDSAVRLPEATGFTMDTWFRPVGKQTGRKTIFRLAQAERTLFELGIKDLTSAKRGVYGLTMPTAGEPVEVVSDTVHALLTSDWNHAALVYKPNNRMILYVNGDPLDTMEVAVSVPNTGLTARVGAADGQNGFDGYLDEFRLSGAARDAWEFNVSTGRIQLAAESVNFGNVLARYSRVQYYEIRNRGVGRLWVTGIATTNAQFTVSPSVFTIGPGGRVVVQVRFSPSAPGVFNALMNIQSTDPVNGGLRSVLLTGTGYEQSAAGAYVADGYTTGLWHMDWVRGDTAVTDTSSSGLTGFLRRPGVSRNILFPRYGASSLYFDGTTGWMELPYHQALDFASSAFTIESWFRPASRPAEGDYDVLVRRGRNASCQYEILYGDSLDHRRGLVARVYNTQGQPVVLYGPPDSTMNSTYYNIGLSWDLNKLRLFLNGVCVDSTALTGGLRPSAAPVAVGGNYGLDHGFNGYIDEFRVSSVARQYWEYNVTGPRLYTTTAGLSFSQVLLGESASTSFQITNTGDQPLKITAVQWKRSVFTAAPTAFEIAMGGNRTVTVTFTPTAAGSIPDTLIVSSNDPSRRTVSIPIAATAVDYRSKVPYATDDYTLALYHFNETTGATVGDASGHERNGTAVNAPERVDGFFKPASAADLALRFNGLTQRIDVPLTDDNGLTFDPATESFSIECFFRTDTIGQALFYKDVHSGTDRHNWGMAIDDDGLLNVTGFGRGNGWVADNAWHHAAFVFDASTQRGTLYLDGSIQFQGPWITDAIDTRTPGSLVIGARPMGGTIPFTDYFEGSIDEIRISDTARKPWEFLFAGSGMELSVLGTPLAGSSQNVDVNVASDADEKTITLFYRTTGDSAYSPAQTTTSDRMRYRATIPAAAVTPAGLELYARKIKGSVSTTQPVVDPVNRPVSVAVRFRSLTPEWTFQAKKYSMVSVPGSLSRPAVRDVLRDDLGAYDPHEWRMFAWKDTSYIEYSDTLSAADSASFNFTPGRAFWVITSTAKTCDVDSGMSVPVSPARRTLQAQWNMVGSPFPFAVSWDDCALSSEAIGTLYAYDGTGYRIDWPTLEPWKGYFVYNAQTAPATVYVPPRKSRSASPLTKRGVLHDLAEGEWIVRLSAQTPDARDIDNFFGVRASARETWDGMDRIEPPPIGDYVSLYTTHADWSENPGAYAADIRQPGAAGYVWDLTMETRLVRKTVDLSWSVNRTLPEGWVAYLVDIDEGTSVCLSEKDGLAVETGKSMPNVKRFQLLVGSREFVESRSEVPLQPAAFGLSQNYPNPFNPVTAIRYSLPKNGRVRLTVYNLMGQRIKVLIDREEKTGAHEEMWDGTDDRGLRAASGIYLYRLEFLDKVAVRKLVLVK
jgi:hypothetical protein